MQILLLEALKANRCDYVRVMIDRLRGVNLKMIDLPELYAQVSCLIFLGKFLFIIAMDYMILFFLQTVSCQKCNTKKDCPHMQWILKVCFHGCFKTNQYLPIILSSTCYYIDLSVTL